MASTFYGTGRRKTARARVYLTKGKGKFSVNNRTADQYFVRQAFLKAINRPLKATKLDGALDVNCYVSGGGISTQADAIKLGVARALLKMDEENRALLRPQKLLTRDPREVERKKYGQKGARARFQYSKR